MHVEPIDPTTLTDDLAEQLAAISNAETAADHPRSAPASGAGLRGEARYGWDDEPFAGLWVAFGNDGTPIGWACVEASDWEDPDLGFVACSVTPTARGQGIGTALLERQTALVREIGRHKLLAFVMAGTPAEALLSAQGWTIGQRTAQRRLRPPDLDFDRIAKLAEDAEQHAADYELVAVDGPIPEEQMAELQSMMEAINDAPLDDVDLAPAPFPPERLARNNHAMSARGQHAYRLMARHRRTGEWAGQTLLYVDATRPGVANQEDTTVVPAHRGHRLGMWMKARMLLWLREAEPDLVTIDTWNAESNPYMVAVNDALGCTVINHGLVMQTRV